MRVWGWTLAVLIVAGVAGAAVYVTSAPPVPQSTAATASSAPQPVFAREVHRFDDSYHRHRHQFQTVSDYSQRVRTNRLVALGGFLVFILLTLPKNARGVRAFYRQMMEKAPLPGDASDDNNRQARKVLFFYLLFLLYQIVQFPLTLGRDNRIQFVSDLAIQVVLLVLVAWAFYRLKRDMAEQWQGDPERRQKMKQWLGEKLEGLNIRWRDIRMMAAGVFIAGFTPALLAHVTGWLDALVNFNQRMVGQ